MLFLSPVFGGAFHQDLVRFEEVTLGPVFSEHDHLVGVFEVLRLVFPRWTTLIFVPSLSMAVKVNSPSRYG